VRLAGRWVKQNDRDYQEDFLTVDIVDDFQTQLPAPQDKSYAMEKTISVLDAVYGQEAESGSTVCAAVVSRELDDAYNIVLASLGDSSAYLVDPDANQIKLLNKWHHPENLYEKDQKENDYIRAHGGWISDKSGVLRVEDDIMITRSLGDRRLPCLNHEADVTYHTGNLGKSKKFLVISSDGLTGVLNKNNILYIVAQHKNQSPSTIAAALGTNATNQPESGDNTSVAVIPIHDIPKKTSIFGGILDGHGGKKVSYPAGRNYSYVLKKITALSHLYNNNIPEVELTILKQNLEISMQKVEAFKKIYNALRDSQSGIFKHNFLSKEDEFLSDAEMLEKIINYAKEYQDSRTAKAWELTQIHYNNCYKSNFELVKEIHIASFERTWFGRTTLFSPSSPPVDLKTEWAKRITDRESLKQTVRAHEDKKPESRTAVIRRRLG
jgi:serine/threonine protein phosphatase PrpC